MIFAENATDGLRTGQIKEKLAQSLHNRNLKKVLLVPPDITRLNSGAGLITALYYDLLRGVHVDILPATGTHRLMDAVEKRAFFGAEIPSACYLDHHWRGGVAKIGEVPADFVREVSDGRMDMAMDVEVSDGCIFKKCMR